MNIVKTINRNIVNQAELIMAKMPQVDLAVTHYFAKGVYARELHIPKGVTLTGKIHKYDQLNILTKGKINVLIDGIIVEVMAPFVVVSPAGTKRIAHAMEDCIWITVHGTSERNINLIEKEFIAQDESEYLEFKKDNQLILPGV